MTRSRASSEVDIFPDVPICGPVEETLHDIETLLNVHITLQDYAVFFNKNTQRTSLCLRAGANAMTTKGNIVLYLDKEPVEK